jgi:hypothetical protein
MKPIGRLIPLTALLLAGSCAGHHAAPEDEPSAIANVRATPRLVAGETTWVASGTGYELVARTKGEIAALQPTLDHVSATLRLAFPSDTLSFITATVRRMSAAGNSFTGPAPVPDGARGPIVELMLPDPKLRAERENARGHAGFDMTPEIIRPAMRSWLAAHASTVTGNPAHFAELTGEADDPRVPAWAIEMLSFGGDSRATDAMTTALATHTEVLIPLATYFTMERPSLREMASDQRGGRGETPRQGEEGSERGGMGGGQRGGMGGRRGGRGGGMGSRSGEEERAAPPLQGAALFAAEAAVLGQYLSRGGYQFVGELVDAQMRGKSLEEIFTARGLGDFPKVDSDFKYWLTQRAASLQRR